MFTYARARRATLLFLFLAVSVAGTVGPASAMLIPPPDPIGTSDTGGTPPDGPGSTDPGPLLPWFLIVLAVALVAACVVMVAQRRYQHTRAAAPRPT